MPRVHRLLGSVVIVFALLVGLPSWVHAWPLGLNNEVNVFSGPGEQGIPKAIPDGSGGMIITWYDFAAGSGPDLRARRVDSTGAPMWSPAGVPLNTGPNSGGSFVETSDGAGGVIAAWTDQTAGYTSAGGLDIRAQRIDATGTPAWGPNGVLVCTAPNNQQFSSIVSDGAGGAIIAWTDNRAGGSNPYSLTQDIYAQRVDASGTPLWTANGVALCTAPDIQSNPLVCEDGAGGAIVAWIDMRSGGATPQDTYAQHVDAAGVPQWAANGTVVAATTGNDQLYRVISDGAGGAIIPMLIYPAPPAFGGADVYLQRMSASGSQLWGPTGTAVSTGTAGKFSPTVASDGSGGAIAVWMDNRSTLHTDLYAQRVDASGSSLWTPNGTPIRSGLVGYVSYFPEIVADNSGGAIVTWPEFRFDPSAPAPGQSEDLYVQALTSNGATRWTPNGLPLATAITNEGLQKMVPDGAGGALVTWERYSSGTSFDIYAQRVSPYGFLGGLPTDRFGNIAGRVTASCPTAGTPLRGVTVDAFETSSGDLLGTAVTDVDGNYRMENLLVSDYSVNLVTPLGYAPATNEAPATVTDGQTATVDFAVSCVASAGTPAASGYWKHQFGVATGGNGNAEMDGPSLCGDLDLIEAHFNENALNQVVVYDPPDGAFCSQKLDLGKTLLNTAGSSAPIDKARSGLFSLLLNVASNKVGLRDVISKDGATVSQAITYCDGLIDNAAGDRNLAAAIADKINAGQQVNTGVIPLSTAQIAYRGALALRTFHVTPNPGRGARQFQFSMDQEGKVRLSVFDVRGRLVSNLMDGTLQAGSHTFAWGGASDAGSQVAHGIYFARLETSAGNRAIKVVQILR